MTRTDIKKQNIMERINSILQNAYSKGVISKIEKMTDILGAVDAYGTFRTRDNCEQPTIDNKGTPKCFFKEDSPGSALNMRSSTAYAIQKEVGFKEKQRALIRELAAIAQALAEPKYDPFRILKASSPVPVDPRMRIPYYSFQELLQRQTRKNAELQRLINDSDLVNNTMQKARREYNEAKGQEILCSPHTNPKSKYGECMGSGVCMIIKPGTGDGAGYITTTNDPKYKEDEEMGDAKCMPLLKNLFLRRKHGENLAHFQQGRAPKFPTAGSTKYGDGPSKHWVTWSVYLPPPARRLPGRSRFRPGKRRERVHAVVDVDGYADETYEAIKAMFEKGYTLTTDLYKQDGNNWQFKDLTDKAAKKLRKGWGDYFTAEEPTKGGVNPDSNQVKMYNKAKETFNSIQENIKELKKTINESPGRETFACFKPPSARNSPPT